MLFYDFFEKSAAKMGRAWKDDGEGDSAIRSGSLTPNQRNCSCAFQENGC